jgi:hypothetical protein
MRHIEAGADGADEARFLKLFLETKYRRLYEKWHLSAPSAPTMLTDVDQHLQ